MWKAIFVSVLMCVVPSVGYCDSLFGTCVRKDGSKVDGTVRISTSWNSKKGISSNGRYRLDFGGKVGKTITVYVEGSRYTTIKVDGDTELNIVVP